MGAVMDPALMWEAEAEAARAYRDQLCQAIAIAALQWRGEAEDAVRLGVPVRHVSVADLARLADGWLSRAKAVEGRTLMRVRASYGMPPA